MSYFCDDCGHSSNDTGTYCPECGTPKPGYGPADRIQYRGCTIEFAGDVWYIHHPSAAADFGSKYELPDAKRLVDRLIDNGTIPMPAEEA